jgi:hypothetical protein
VGDGDCAYFVVEEINVLDRELFLIVLFLIEIAVWEEAFEEIFTRLQVRRRSRFELIH